MRTAEGWSLRCIGCTREYASDISSFRCPRCSDLLELVKKRRVKAAQLFAEGKSGVWKYGTALPIHDFKPVTLGEGGTPLVKSAHISGELGVSNLYFKFDGQNPTGSFKDRGMTVAVTRALQSGAKLLLCASTGNTSASLAAYAARAGLRSAVLIPSGKVAKGKLVQAIAHGTTIIRVVGNFDRALEMALQSGASLRDVYLVNSINPYRVEGQKTVAYEMYEQLGFVAPDCVVLPLGNAGNISAVWKGFKELVSWGVIKKGPRLIGVQASGASPIAKAVALGLDVVRPEENPETMASAIRIGNPISWKKAMRAIRESNGTAVAVTDEEIRKARARLAAREGIFSEPASAAPVAALSLLGDTIEKDAKVVCIATGHGLKDQESVEWNVEDVSTVSDGKELRATLRKMTAERGRLR